MSVNMDEVKLTFSFLLERARTCNNSNSSVHYTQALCNMANAVSVLQDSIKKERENSSMK